LEHQVRVKGSVLEHKGLSSINRAKRTYEEKPKVYGLILSIILIMGSGFISGFRGKKNLLNISETVGLSCLMLMMCAIISVALFNRATYGFVFFGMVGVFGWGLFIKKTFFTDRESISRFFSHRFWSGYYKHILITVGIVIFIWSMLMAVVVVPDDWDAWAIWGSKAKVMALGNGPLKDVTYFDHPDYPLLWPAVWAFSGWCSGGWEEHWSKGWGPFFMLLTAWQIYSIIKRETEQNNIALTGAVMFLSIPMVPLIASWSYAEAPLWLMMICAFGRVLRWRKDRQKVDLFLSALFAAAAAYTKNEGILFAVLILLWVLTIGIKDWKNILIYYSVALLALYLPWFYWVRFTLKMKSHATAGISLYTETVAKALNRLPEALTLIGNIWMDIRQWSIVLWFAGIAAIIIFFKGKKNERVDLMVPILLLFGYLVITLFHFESLGYQVGSSWNRLTLHALPMMIVTIVNSLHRWIEKSGIRMWQYAH
jgi:hypothetical protein